MEYHVEYHENMFVDDSTEFEYHIEQVCGSYVSVEVSELINQEWWNTIDPIYSNGLRFYHNLHHVDGMVRVLGRIPYLKSPSTLWLATLYHDLILVPGRKDNEERSAAYALRMLRKFGVPLPTLLKVHNYILKTKDHPEDYGNDPDLAAFLDADLYYFREHWGGYLEITNRIIREYHLRYRRRYTLVQILAGRRDFLKEFQKRKRIYLHHVNSPYDGRARENIEKEIDLRQGQIEELQGFALGGFNPKAGDYNDVPLDLFLRGIEEAGYLRVS